MMALREELGDLLLQIVLHAQIGTEEGEFTMAEVINGIQTKILRRHPHVFGETQVASVDHVLHNWEALKATEREIEGDGKGILDGVPLCLPALAQASEIQARVVRVGFDWPDVEGVLEKISEEIEEIRQSDAETRSDEIGDLLFSIVNYARWAKVDSEAALREANLRFRSRFRNVEESARAAGRELTELTLKEMNAMWEAAKRKDEDLGRDTK
jgi:tetrapyrrole methylase family protein/MazG family protein